MLTKSLNFGIHRSGPRLEGLKSLKGEFLSQDLIIARASLKSLGNKTAQAHVGYNVYLRQLRVFLVYN
jgi:hypothetical protein